jgi:hypothetical protein
MVSWSCALEIGRAASGRKVEIIPDLENSAPQVPIVPW